MYFELFLPHTQAHNHVIQSPPMTSFYPSKILCKGWMKFQLFSQISSVWCR